LGLVPLIVFSMECPVPMSCPPISCGLCLTPHGLWLQAIPRPRPCAGLCGLVKANRAGRSTKGTGTIELGDWPWGPFMLSDGSWSNRLRDTR
jgi:hypothetical protein